MRSLVDRDFRVRAFRDALRVLDAPPAAGEPQTRVERIQQLLSDPTTEPLEKLDMKSARGAYDRWQLGVALMRYIDLHAHMVSRTTDDYVQMALTGCVAVTEPAFWAGWDRSSADGFDDYFRQLTDFEPKRAAVYGIRHLRLALPEPEGRRGSRSSRARCCARIPKYLHSPTVLGIGEIGLNRVTRNEIATFRDHVELALEHDQLIHIHTPHLEDKYKGTRTIVDVARGRTTASTRRA